MKSIMPKNDSKHKKTTEKKKEKKKTNKNHHQLSETFNYKFKRLERKVDD